MGRNRSSRSYLSSSSTQTAWPLSPSCSHLLRGRGGLTALPKPGWFQDHLGSFNLLFFLKSFHYRKFQIHAKGRENNGSLSTHYQLTQQSTLGLFLFRENGPTLFPPPSQPSWRPLGEQISGPYSMGVSFIRSIMKLEDFCFFLKSQVWKLQVWRTPEFLFSNKFLSHRVYKTTNAIKSSLWKNKTEFNVQHI